MASQKSEKIKFFVLDVQQGSGGKEDQGSEILLWGRTEKGEPALVIDKSFRPYFFVSVKKEIKKAELDELIEKVREASVDEKKPEEVEALERSFFGRKRIFLKVTVPGPSDVTKFRDLLKDWADVKGIYEYDIPFYRKYMLEREIIPLTWVSVEGDAEIADDGCIRIDAKSLTPSDDYHYPKLMILALDIETIKDGGEDKIIMASVKDTNGFEKVLSYKKAKSSAMEVVENEKDLIERLSEVVRERAPDIIVTYNGDRFDFERLSEKAKKYDTKLMMGRTERSTLFKRRGKAYSAWIEGRVHIDLFNFIENILFSTLSSEVLSLQRVSREILGKGKKDMEWSEIQKAWEDGKGLEEVAAYCLRDSELTLSLAVSLLPQVFEMCRITGQTPFDTSRMMYSQLVEWLLIREAHKGGELVPNRPKYEEIEIRRRATPYTGGYVYPPKSGIHEGIALLDFQGLYPSITVTHNVSPETLYCHCCGNGKKESVHRVPSEDYFFCKDHKGFVAKTLEELVRVRSGVKEEMKKLSPKSKEYKILNARQYALKVLANASYGYYGYAGSRWYSRVCAESITAWGRYYIQRVIKKAEKMGYKVIYGDTDSLFIKVKSMDDALKFLGKVNRSLPGVMELEFQGLYRAGLFVPAKTGLTAKKRYALIDNEGNITIRGFEKVRRDWSRVARETQELVLRSVLQGDSPEKAVRIVRRTIRDIERGKMDKKRLVIYTQLTKPISEYEQKGPHVIAAKKAIAKGLFVSEGSVIAYVITKGTGSISERAEPAEYAENYDPEYYVNNQVIPAAMRVLAGLGYTEDSITGSSKEQSSLDRFVKKTIKGRIQSGLKKIGKSEGRKNR